MQTRKIVIAVQKAGMSRAFTTGREPVNDVLCAYDLTKFCSPECSACQIDKGVKAMCMRNNFCIGTLPE